MTRPDRLGAHRLLHAGGITVPAVSLLLVAHLAFGAMRLPYGGVAKRIRVVREWHQRGVVDWHFQLTDAETRRVADWLCLNVPPGQVVLYEGAGRGYIQVLAALLYPRLLVAAAEGRPVFTGHAPWHEAKPGTVPVITTTIDTLRIDYR